MKSPVAHSRFLPASIAIAFAIGSGGFAAGWCLRRPPDIPPAQPSTGSIENVAPAGVVFDDHSDDYGHVASRAATERSLRQLSPGDARTRIQSWVAAGCPRGDYREIEALLEAWSADDAREVLNYIHHVPVFRNRTQAYSVPLAVIARCDAGSVIQWLKTELPAISIQSTVAAGVISRLATPNPRVALELAFTDEQWLHPEIVGAAMGALARDDPAAALAFHARLPEAGQWSATRCFVETWFESSPDAATEWTLNHANTTGARFAVQSVLGNLANTHPERLPALLADPRLSAELRSATIQELCYGHPELGLELLSTLSHDDARSSISTLFETLFADDPDGILAIAHNFLPPEELALRVRSEWRQWAHSDAPAAAAWAASITDPAIRKQLHLETRSGEVARDPKSYLASLGDQVPSGDESELFVRALNTLARQDPEHVAQWVTNHAASTPPAVVRGLAGTLCESDETAAMTWIQSLPPGATRDIALATVSTRWTRSRDFTLAETALGAINNPTLQIQERFRLFSRMFADDRNAARRWIESQPLSAETRQTWLALAPQGPPY